MGLLSVILVLVAVALTVAVVAAPLRQGRAHEDERAHEAEVADLEAAKAARYREIREAEMDFRTGKLSEADWRAIDRELRAEAIAVLRQLDRLGVPTTDGPAAAGDALAPAVDAVTEAGDALAVAGDALAETGDAPVAPGADALAEPAAPERVESLGEEPTERVGQPPAA